MKYKYEKTMFFAGFFSLYILGCLMSFALFYCFGGERSDYYEIAIEGAFVVIAFMAISSKEYYNRYVDFYKESVRFNSFRVTKIRKLISLNIRYDTITSVKALVLPIVGIWKIKVISSGFAYPISISFCFSKYAELCEKLCSSVKEYNPDAYIDSRIIKFIERKKKHEGN